MNTRIAIIGAGPAGEAAAKSLRQESRGSPLDITLIEKEQAGGLCLNKGCIPSKTLLEHVRKKAESRQTIVWDALQDFKNSVVTTIRKHLQSSLKSNKINLIQGLATFESKNSILVKGSDGSHNLPFDKAIITTGTDIFFPPPLDQYKDELLNSDKLLDMRSTPASLVIIGGGAVGLEFACLLNAVGSKVTIVEMQEQILPGEDPQVASLLSQIFERRGINVKTGTKVTHIHRDKSLWKIKLATGELLETPHVMACVGRVPNPQTLNVDKAEIRLDRSRIVVNEKLQTTNPNIFAAGDVLTTRLAHAAAAQAEVAARNALGKTETFDDSLVPRCLYTWPEVASVGLWKYQSDEKNQSAKVARAFYQGSGKALASDETEGFVQVVFEPQTKKILGGQIIGAHATELIHIFSVALKAGMTTNDLSQVMFAHPTLSEMVKDACKKA